MKLCKGITPYYTECEYIDECKIRVHYATDLRNGNNNELHQIFDEPMFFCKRDKVEFEPISEEEFRVIWDRARDEERKRCLDIAGSYELVVEAYRQSGVVL